jgi:ATP/maltotriose-dependent transcriptional regulator MalT/two-component SAPR family response regulator
LVNDTEIPISKTKVILPKRRAELLTRRRLLDSLYEILDRKLVMVSAPAGYGKTSLLIDLAYHSDLPFCWLALDQLDCEPQRFIAYVIAALAERFPRFGNRSLSVLNTLTSFEGGVEKVLVTLVNEIYDEIHEHFVLVLDDFHLLDEVQPIQYFVNRFIQLAGENCHLILSSRSLPRLSDMTLLVAREQVGGLDFSDLSFRPEEIQALLAQNRQVHISDEDAGALVNVTEGWITGLQFADLNLAGAGGSRIRPVHTAGVSVFDYLGQQVLEQQPEALQVFLLRSSLLEEYDAALCEAVLAPLYAQPQNWQNFLETIIQKNLFALPVGANGQWLRYHHLFRDFLQERFRREHPQEVRSILERLAHFHEEHAEWEKAYQLYKGLGDTNALADMVERAGISMYQHAMLTLESWLTDLPPSLFQKRPGLLSLRGVVATTKGDIPEGIGLLNRAVDEFRAESNTNGLALALVRRGNAHRLLGDYKEAIQDADEAAQLTEKSDDLQWNYADALRIKGLSSHRQGQTLQSAKYLERALDIYIRVNDAPSIPMLLLETGMVHLSMGNYTDAKKSYERALQLSQKTGNLGRQANLLNNLGVLHHQLGEYERAAQSLEEGLLCARRSGYKRMEAVISISLGDLYTELEDFEIARQNYRNISPLVEQLGERFLTNYLALAEVNLSLLKKDTREARLILEQIEASIHASDSRYEYGLYQFMLGRLRLQDGQPDQAAVKLREARDCFTQDGRETEITWSRLWLAAAQYQHGEQAAARLEIRTALEKPRQINHNMIVAARQARQWLEGLRHDPEVRAHLRPLFDKAERLDEQLPRTRRQLRRLAKAVEIPAPSLNIHAFGRGQVWVNGRLVTKSDWQTRSVRELFFYFLTANRPLAKEQIGDTLWENTIEPAKLRLKFKNEIYRLRRAVGQDTILFENEYYRFNSGMDHEYDVEAFEAYLTKAKSSPGPQDQIAFYQKAVDLVRGQYLEDIDSTWAWPERERLSQKFLSACVTLAELLYRDGQMTKALQICQLAQQYEATYEAVYRLMMQIYSRMGDKASIVHTYEACERIMNSVFNLPPAQETRTLYHELIS